LLEGKKGILALHSMEGSSAKRNAETIKEAGDRAR
jgi:hypothetical protein